jgi:hypothetical protein
MLDKLDVAIFQHLNHGLVFKEFGLFGQEGNYYRFNCPNCQKNQIKGKGTFFARRGLPYGRCRLCGYRQSWWGRLGKGSPGLRRLAESAGLSLNDLAPDGEDQFIKALKHSDLMEVLFHLTTTLLLEDTHAEGLAHLYSKGFSLGEVKETELGYYPSCEEIKAQMLSEGHGQEELEAAGVLAPELGSQYKLVLPYRSGAGRALGLLAYKLVRTTNGLDKPLLRTNETATPFNLHLALRSRGFEDSGQLIVLDEPFEAAMLVPLGVDNAIAPVEGDLSQTSLSLLKDYGVKGLVFCIKTANPEKLDELANTLRPVEGIELSAVELRLAKTPIEYIRSRGQEAWRKLLTRAKPLILGAIQEERKPVHEEKEPVKLKEEAPVPAKTDTAPAAPAQVVVSERPKEVAIPVERPVAEGPAPFSAREVIERLVARQPIKTGYPRLDAPSAISQEGLTVLLGEPGCGKTLLALNLLLNMMCYHEEMAFILFSTEGARQLTLVRLLGIITDVPPGQVEEELKKGGHSLEVKRGLDLLKGMGLENRLYFFSNPSTNTETIFSSAQAVSLKGRPIGAIFIDELHQIKEGQDLLETTQKLKTMRMLAETLHTAVICTLVTSDKGLLNTSALLPYANTVFRLGTPPTAEGVLSNLRAMWARPVEGKKELMLSLLSSPGRDTAFTMKFHVKPGGKLVEQG